MAGCWPWTGLLAGGRTSLPAAASAARDLGKPDGPAARPERADAQVVCRAAQQSDAGRLDRDVGEGGRARRPHHGRCSRWGRRWRCASCGGLGSWCCSCSPRCFIPGVSLGLANAFLFQQLGVFPVAVHDHCDSRAVGAPVRVSHRADRDGDVRPCVSRGGLRARGEPTEGVPDGRVARLSGRGFWERRTFSIILSFKRDGADRGWFQGPLNTVQTYIWSRYLQVGLTPSIYALMSLMILLTLLLIACDAVVQLADEEAARSEVAVRRCGCGVQVVTCAGKPQLLQQCLQQRIRRIRIELSADSRSHVVGELDKLSPRGNRHQHGIGSLLDCYFDDTDGVGELAPPSHRDSNAPDNDQGRPWCSSQAIRCRAPSAPANPSDVPALSLSSALSWNRELMGPWVAVADKFPGTRVQILLGVPDALPECRWHRGIQDPDTAAPCPDSYFQAIQAGAGFRVRRGLMPHTCPGGNGSRSIASSLCSSGVETNFSIPSSPIA